MCPGHQQFLVTRSHQCSPFLLNKPCAFKSCLKVCFWESPNWDAHPLLEHHWQEEVSMIHPQRSGISLPQCSRIWVSKSKDGRWAGNHHSAPRVPHSSQMNLSPPLPQTCFSLGFPIQGGGTTNPPSQKRRRSCLDFPSSPYWQSHLSLVTTLGSDTTSETITTPSPSHRPACLRSCLFLAHPTYSLL